jgi:hypothetical protein
VDDAGVLGGEQSRGAARRAVSRRRWVAVDPRPGTMPRLPISRDTLRGYVLEELLAMLIQNTGYRLLADASQDPVLA